jgi:hypothetical protein
MVTAARARAQPGPRARAATVANLATEAGPDDPSPEHRGKKKLRNLLELLESLPK